MTGFRTLAYNKTTPNNRWVLICGGPNSGKTTIVNRLEDLGYKVKHEEARPILDRYIEEKVPLEKIVEDKIVGSSFQDEIALAEYAAEQKQPKEELVFFDRVAIEYFALLNYVI